ncbi:calcium:proton antiporter [Nocardioides stalactiti]|uniref:calcium:proton antiporter n=1 Tax=Nocardioides stalactiti TaxID=2755356 RepID=UPI0016048E77|nr:ionic transporter y4hA [Nocardioides stalactiti]
MSTTTAGRLSWAVASPPAAAVVLAFTWGTHPGTVGNVVVGVALVAAVLAAVHHAEVVAHRLGEPFGSLLLAVAVTIIEVGLIVTLMATGKGDTSTLARDTVFAAVMITINGIVGLALVVGALRHHLAVFNPEGTGSALATVVALAGLTLVVPSFTTSADGPVFTGSQLAFAAVASLALYAMFVVTQTVRHRDFFLPVTRPGERGPVDDDGDGHADPPSGREALTSLALLSLALVCVVGLAKVESYAIEDAVSSLGLPHAVVGVVIALLVLLPESISAVRSAVRDRVQTSFNLAYGSAMASIGLTIPAIAVASIWLDGELALGIDPLQLVLLVLSVLVSVLTVVPGRAKPLAGGVHLVLFAAFLFLSAAP